MEKLYTLKEDKKLTPQPEELHEEVLQMWDDQCPERSTVCV
jgi:hypothetical protein